MKNDKELHEGYQDSIDRNAFLSLMETLIQETTDEEAIELWKMITDKYPALALKVILDKIEKTKEV